MEGRESKPKNNFEEAKDKDKEILSARNRLEQIKIERKGRNTNKSKFFSTRTKFYCYLIWIFVFTVFINLLRPLTIILNLIFSVTFDYEKFEETSKNLPKILSTIGIILIFILPFIPFFIHLLKVFSMAKKFTEKIFYFLLLLIESIFEIPLTILYNSPLHSMFLVNQEGPAQILNSWLIFFPTEYIISWVNLIKNFLLSVFYIMIPIITGSTPQINSTFRYLEFSYAFNGSVIAFNIINFFGTLLILFFKFIMVKKLKIDNKEEIKVNEEDKKSKEIEKQKNIIDLDNVDIKVDEDEQNKIE